jgi:signal transduction histidine kinase
LGLTVVKAIAEAHGGRVELESSPGAGATFTLTIPADRPERGPDDAVDA